MITNPSGLDIDAKKLVTSLGFQYQNGVLTLEGHSTKTLADTFGTPCYVYSKAAIVQAYKTYEQAFTGIDHRICYAVKANSNLAILRLLAQLGAGFDIVSKGELLRVLQVTDAKRVVYSGVGKTADDIKTALVAGIDCFNVEALSELDLINDIAGAMGQRAAVSLRINPDVDANTHPYIATGLKSNKFGIAYDKALASYDYASTLTHLDIVGVDCHIGSQIVSVAPFCDAIERLALLVERLKDRGIPLRHMDIGGGLGVRYIDETTPSVDEYASALLPTLKRLGLRVYLEPGRRLLANAGVLLTKVDVLKPTDDSNFAVVDASMAELLRPALYQAKMAVIPCVLSDTPKKCWQVVGAVCESADVLASNRMLGLAVGDVLAITGAGAYGFCMASNYNSRPRPCELLVDKDKVQIIRRREQFADLWRLEI